MTTAEEARRNILYAIKEKFIIVVVFVYLIHRYVPHHILRNPY